MNNLSLLQTSLDICCADQSCSCHASVMQTADPTLGYNLE